MASNKFTPHGQHSRLDVEDLTKGLEKELRSRTGVGSSIARASSSTELAKTLASCVRNQRKNSPRPANPGGAILVSSPYSNDSSISGGTPGHDFAAGRVEKNTLASTMITSATTRSMGCSQPIDITNEIPGSNTPSALAMQAERGARLSSQSRTPMVASERCLLSASASAGAATLKVTKKRNRPSKRPPTKLIEATPEEFQATVQRLTGCEAAPAQVPSGGPPVPSHCERPGFSVVPQHGGSLLRPQPPRSRTTHVDSKTSPLGLGAPSVVSSVPRPSPASEASPKVPSSRPYDRDSSCTGSSALNYCMGYGQSSGMIGNLPLEDIIDRNRQSMGSGMDRYDDLIALFASNPHNLHESTGSPASFGVDKPYTSESNLMDDISSRPNDPFSSGSRLSSSNLISQSPGSEVPVAKYSYGEIPDSLDSDGDLESAAKTENIVTSWLAHH